MRVCLTRLPTQTRPEALQVGVEQESSSGGGRRGWRLSRTSLTLRPSPGRRPWLTGQSQGDKQTIVNNRVTSLFRYSSKLYFQRVNEC